MENINAKANFIDKQSKYRYFTCQSFSSVIFGGHSVFFNITPGSAISVCENNCIIFNFNVIICS